MTDLEPVSGGPEEILVSIPDIEDSEFGGILEKRKAIVNTERRNVIIGGWIKEAKTELIFRTGKTEAQLTSTDTLREMSKRCVILMVGRIILKRAQISRIEITETDYLRMVQENQNEIDNLIMNLKPMSSPISITSAEPTLIDPDSDHPEDEPGVNDR